MYSVANNWDSDNDFVISCVGPLDTFLSQLIYFIKVVS
jgi:hypothetical protein